MNLIDLIQSDKEQAQAAIANLMQTKVFDYLDNYVLETESVEELDESVAFNPDVKQKRSTPVKPLSDKEKKQPFNYDQWKNNKKGMKESEELDETVVPGSVKKDAKGNVLSFKTEDYEAMDQDEFDAVVENFEQLDELSKNTLVQYASAAGKDRIKHVNAEFDTADSKKLKFHQRKAKNRGAGVANALGKFTFSTEDYEAMDQDEFDTVVENFEQLDELSKSTLNNYVNSKMSVATNKGRIPYANISDKDKTNVQKAFSKAKAKAYTPEEEKSKQERQNAYIAADGAKHGGRY